VDDEKRFSLLTNVEPSFGYQQNRASLKPNQVCGREADKLLRTKMQNRATGGVVWIKF